jgi:hypothetical protein
MAVWEPHTVASAFSASAQARLIARQQHAQPAQQHAGRQPNKVLMYTRGI